MNSNPNIVWWKKNSLLEGSALFPFSIYYFSPDSCGAAANDLLPRKTKINRRGLKENLVSGKVMLCWTFIVFGRREKQGRRSIKEVSVPFVTSSEGHFSCTAFLFFNIPFTLSEEWSSKRSEGWTFLRFDDFSQQRCWWKRFGNISVPLFNKTSTLFIDLYFLTLKLPLAKKYFSQLVPFQENLCKNHKSKWLKTNQSDWKWLICN